MAFYPITEDQARRITAEYLRLFDDRGLEPAVAYLRREIVRVMTVEPVGRMPSEALSQGFSPGGLGGSKGEGERS